jgi:hypothetical protein
MTNKGETLKIIKEKVDSRSNGKIKLKKQISCKFKEGTFKHTEKRRITTLQKQGNSVMWIDDSYQIRNINILELKDLHKIMWQIISDKEKKEIALAHLIETKEYLNQY